MFACSEKREILREGRMNKKTEHCFIDSRSNGREIFIQRKTKEPGRSRLCFIVPLFVERGRFHLDALARQLLYCTPGDNGLCKGHSNSGKVATCRVGKEVTRGRGVAET